MTNHTVCLGDLAIAHYGMALKEGDRDRVGNHTVFGSSGPVGNHSKVLVDRATVIVGRKGSVGSVTWAPHGGWPIDTAYYLELRDPGRTDLRYLYWALRHAGLGNRAITTSIPGLNREELYRTRIYFPLLGEQHRIAAILDRTDAVRLKRSESIRLLDGFLPSAFLDFFGDPVCNEKGWPLHTLQSAISAIEAGTSVIGKSRPPMADEWAVLKISAVTSGRYLPTECKVVLGVPHKVVVPRKGDLLFSRANTRELVAATCLVTADSERLFLPDKLWRLTPYPHLVTAEFLRFLLANSDFRVTLTRHATGSSGSMLNISQEKLLKLQVPLPPLALQQDFARLVWRTYESRDRLECVDAQAESLCESLTHRSFRGPSSQEATIEG